MDSLRILQREGFLLLQFSKQQTFARGEGELNFWATLAVHGPQDFMLNPVITFSLQLDPVPIHRNRPLILAATVFPTFPTTFCKTKQKNCLLAIALINGDQGLILQHILNE